METGIDKTEMENEPVPTRTDLLVIADALRRTELIMRMHYRLRSDCSKPVDVTVPPENTIEAASQLLGWAASMLAGQVNGPQPALPDEKAASNLSRSLRKAMWS